MRDKFNLSSAISNGGRIVNNLIFFDVGLKHIVYSGYDVDPKLCGQRTFSATNWHTIHVYIMIEKRHKHRSVLPARIIWLSGRE